MLHIYLITPKYWKKNLSHFLTLDIQCNVFTRKTFCSITNFHNKLSKLMSSNRIYLIFNARFFSNKNNLYISSKRSTKTFKRYLFDRVKILIFVLPFWFSSLFANKEEETWKVWKKSIKIKLEKESKLRHQKFVYVSKNVLHCLFNSWTQLCYVDKCKIIMLPRNGTFHLRACLKSIFKYFVKR